MDDWLYLPYSSPCAAIFGCDMLFDIPVLADWTKIGDSRQCTTDLNTLCGNKTPLDWDYNFGDTELLQNDDILCQSEIRYEYNPLLSNQFIQIGQL
jgi:hypothetical protein